MELLIGADPELFVTNGRKNVSGYGLIPGTKEDPHPVANGAVQVDGMALEFNIDPAATEEEFVNNIKSVMSQLEAMVPDYELVAKPTAKFSKKTISEQPPEALELGCDPDYNAYTGEENPAPEIGDGLARTGAGHIHIGWTTDVDPKHPEHMEACCMIAKQLDYYLGVPSILFDDDVKRRQMYGKAGCFRPKSYGMEYRTPSNAWLKSEDLMRWVYRTVVKAANDLEAGESMFNKYGNIGQMFIDKACPENMPLVKRKAKRITEMLDIPLP